MLAITSSEFTYFAPGVALLLAFGITYFSIPAIIRLSLVKKLYDVPDARKNHAARISPLGGMAIFGGMIISFVFSTAYLANPALNSVLVALFILFITGVKDDLYPLVPYKKLIGQIIAAAIVVVQGNIRLESFYGIAGINELPYFISVGLSIVFFLGIINSFNFIDGINGLSSSLGLLVSGTYAVWFAYLNEPLFLILSLSIFGSQLAFLRYNLIKAKIFMGDSGSMILGFLAALLTIYFLKANEQSTLAVLKKVDALVFAFAVIIIPVLDTARVILLRLFIYRTSPFTADRNHIHHTLLDIGLSHAKASLLLFTVNLGLVLFTFFLNPIIRASVLFLLLLIMVFVLMQIPALIKKNRASA